MYISQTQVPVRTYPAKKFWDKDVTCDIGNRDGILHQVTPAIALSRRTEVALEARVNLLRQLLLSNEGKSLQWRRWQILTTIFPDGVRWWGNNLTCGSAKGVRTIF